MIDDDELKARFAHLVELMGENYEARDSAVELVRSRDILPAEADRLALLFGWYPFTIKPTGRKYDPMEAVYWTPAMVLSWIANRSIAPETGPEWRRDAYRWRDIPRFGWDVVGYDPLTLTGFRQEAILRAVAGGARDEPEKLDLAMEELLRACRRGELGMSAHDPSTGIRRAPTRLEWQDMDFAEDGNRDVLRSPVGLWCSPTAEAEVVMTIWPSPPVEPAATIIEEEPAPKEPEGSELDAKKGSEADARRAWEQELAEVRGGTQRQRSQKAIEADYPTRFHVSRETVRSWIKGTRGRGRPAANGAK